MPKGQTQFTCIDCKIAGTGGGRQKRCFRCRRIFQSSPKERFRNAGRNWVKAAVAAGLLVRQPCEVCGEQKSHGHHPDYTKPLEVIWLCPMHHRVLHAYGEILGTWKDWTAEFAFSPHLPTALITGSPKADDALQGKLLSGGHDV